MRVGIESNKKFLGFIDFSSKEFSLIDFKNRAQKQKMEKALTYFYEHGIPAPQTEETKKQKVLKPKDSKFLLELGIRLQNLGFTITDK